MAQWWDLIVALIEGHITDAEFDEEWDRLHPAGSSTSPTKG